MIIPDIKGNMKAINWSNFLIKFLLGLITFWTVPHLLFWIPFWLQMPPWNLKLGWELFGNTWLPSVILTIIYILFCLGFTAFSVKCFKFKFKRWPYETSSDQLTFEDIKIPIGGGNHLVGDLVKGPSTPKKNAPVFIVCHGLASQRKRFYVFGLPMSFLGFAILFYDARGHGETNFGEVWDAYYIIKDMSKVIDYIEKRAETKGDLNPKEIVAWGASMGGGVVLNEGYLDRRIKFCMAVCTWGDYKVTTDSMPDNYAEAVVRAGYEMLGVNLMPTKLQSRFISPISYSFNKKKGFFDQPVWWDINNDYRVMIAHCEDDEVIDYVNFDLIKDFLHMKPENYISFKKGNHAFKGNETALVGKMLLWFWQRGY